MTPLSTESLHEIVRSLFVPASDGSRRKSMTVGAELELIPVHVRTGKRVLAGAGNPSGAEFAQSLADEFGWTEDSMGNDPSCWHFTGGRVSFEPGGQLELSSAVFPTASSLLTSLEGWLGILSARAAIMGIELKAIGIEDHSSIEAVPLQLQRQRYRRMTEYFDSLGPYGVLMMRQTASLQINIDHGDSPLQRWRLLNALAPYLVAIFANSPVYAGANTGHKSYRAHVWRMLDHRRTGLIYDSRNEVDRYLRFALDAPVIMGNQFAPFRELLDSQTATREMWDTHLSTLFPEIRPRDYFEIRSIDSINQQHLPAAIAFVTGIVYSERSSIEAMKFLGAPDPLLLVRAGKSGLADRDLLRNATTLVRLALDGSRALGPDYISHGHLLQAEHFFETYTLNGRSPGDNSSETS